MRKIIIGIIFFITFVTVRYADHTTSVFANFDASVPGRAMNLTLCATSMNQTLPKEMDEYIILEKASTEDGKVIVFNILVDEKALHLGAENKDQFVKELRAGLVESLNGTLEAEKFKDLQIPLKVVVMNEKKEKVDEIVIVPSELSY